MSDRSGLHVAVGQDQPIPLSVALDCEPGALLAIVGPSGSGKTTLLRAIAGLHKPARGSIRVGNGVWFDADAGIHIPPMARRSGFVFQEYALFPHLSALENLTVAMGHRPARERQSQARELLRLVNLDGLAARRPATLSGGQRQRVALARALARDPAVLLLDEPFSAVDQITRRKLQRELVLLRDRLRMPVLLVTHDLEEAVALADRICVLHHGRSLQCGTPEAVMLRPDTPEVARLMGQPNLFRATVTARDADDGRLFLDWQGRPLDAEPDTRFAPGDRVQWMIPPSHILLHRRGRPSRGERENPVDGRIASLAVLGEHTSVELAVGEDQARLHFTIGTHAARRNGLAAGVEARVSLLADGLHLMPDGS